MSQKDFGAAFKNSQVKRAKLRGLQRNAAVVLGNVDASDDAGADPVRGRHIAPRYACGPR